MRLSRFILYLLIPAIIVGCGGDEDPQSQNDRSRDSFESADVALGPEDLEPIPEGYVPDNAQPDQVEALERANWYRWQSGLPPLDMIDAINRACQAHSDYYADNKSNYDSTGLSPHNENVSWPGFTGVAPWDRMGKFGYSAGASEVMAFVHNSTLSVDGWMNTLYHRIPFMDASLTACGYGAAGGGGWQNSTKVDTMDFGWEDVEGNDYTGPELEGIYPPPGSSGIPPSFDGLESPQPPPPASGYPSGTIVSVTWSMKANFAVDEHRIWKDGSEQELAHVWLDPGNDSNLSNSSTIAMYANQPLEKGSKYWIEIKGTKNGAPWEKKWFFHTERY